MKTTITMCFHWRR